MKKIKICIVGPGVVGQATGKVFARQGFPVCFLGGSEDKRKALKKEGFEVYERNELFDGSYDSDVTFLTVPTPTIDNKINLDAIKSASIDLGKRLKKTKNYHVVVVKSTVPPGTTEKIVIRNIEKYSGKKVGKDFGACMNPEYLREVSAYKDTLNSWLIVIGQYDKKSGDILKKVYSKFTCPIYRVAIKEAEMQKYIHNLYNATKISFFNEMRMIAEKIGANADTLFQLTTKSAEGLWNPNYGTKNHGPYSGSCLPKDTQAFFDWARNKKYNPQLLQAVIEVNNVIKKRNGFHESNSIGHRL